MTPEPNMSATGGQLYMIIETFRDGPGPVYERFASRGRMLPDNLVYVDSWVETTEGRTCYQLMRTNNPELFEEWFEHWDDIVDFEVIPVEQFRTANQERPNDD